MGVRARLVRSAAGPVIGGLTTHGWTYWPDALEVAAYQLADPVGECGGDGRERELS